MKYNESFRTYDIRGLVPDELDEEGVQLIGKAFGTYLRQKGMRKVMVGYDNRIPLQPGAPGSDRLSGAFIEGVLSTGCNVADGGLLPTPVVYHSLQRLHRHAGAIITGSHNTREYNGIKLTQALGNGNTLVPVAGTLLQELAEIFRKRDFSVGKGRIDLQGAQFQQECLRNYVEDMRQHLRPLTRSIRVVVDPGNAVPSLAALPLLEAMNCRVYCLFCELDGTFPNHTPNPERPNNLRTLGETVQALGADLGVAYDGDGDRVGVVDEAGNIVYTDALLSLIARQMLREQPGGTIIFDTLCSESLAIDVAAYGGRPIRSRTGYSIIRQRMIDENALLAGEISGHIFFGDRGLSGYDDGIYASARVIELLASSQYLTLSEMVSSLPEWFSMRQQRIPFGQVDKNQQRKILESFRKDAENAGASIDESDGITALFFENGRLAGRAIARLSSTEPIASVACEAQTAILRDQLIDLLHSSLSRSIGRGIRD